jgi:hypothetical protein
MALTQQSLKLARARAHTHTHTHTHTQTDRPDPTTRETKYTVALYCIYSAAEGRHKVYRAVSMVISRLPCTTIVTMNPRQVPGNGEEDV